MPSKQTLFIIVASLSAVVRSLPSPSPDLGLKVIRQFEVDGGNFTLYGDKPLARRDTTGKCGSRTDTVTCGKAHYGSYFMCSSLIYYLEFGLEHDNKLKGSPRSACLHGDGQISGMCCISWADSITDAYIQDFEFSSRTVLDKCKDKSGEWVSGLIREASIGSSCTTVCISDRAGKCS